MCPDTDVDPLCNHSQMVLLLPENYTHQRNLLQTICYLGFVRPLIRISGKVILELVSLACILHLEPAPLFHQTDG